MSCLERMSILGIRSFGPEDQHKQAIAFEPITLILGPNGTGKTTIIECLKYITTGDQPPNTKGGAFVHDPKVCQETEVKAQVRLQFRDVNGAQCVVARSLVATQKQKKVETKTLDSTIKRVNPTTKQEVTVTSRCLDINKEMISALGVSKPILDNVIFCHQEESNWPLSEGKALKQKFDDIFASTRYVKALESILKLKKDKAQEVTTMKAEIKYVQQNKDKADEFSRNMASIIIRAESEAVELGRIESALKPVEEKIEKIVKDREGIEKVKVEIAKKDTERQHMQRQCQDLRRQVKQEFSGSDSDLVGELHSCMTEVQQLNTSRSSTIQRQAPLEAKMDKLRNEKAELLRSKGALEQEEKVYRENVESRDAKLRRLAKESGWNDFGGTLSDADVKAFGDLVRGEVVKLQSEVESLKADYTHRESDVSSRMTDSKVRKGKLDESERLKEAERRRKLSDAQALERRISAMDAAPKRLSTLAADLQQTEMELERVETSPAIDLRSAQGRLAELQQAKGRLGAELSAAHRLSVDRAELDGLCKGKADKEDELRRRKGKVEDTVVELLHRFPPEGLLKEVESYLQTAKQELEQDRSEVRKLTVELATCEQERKALRDEMQKMESKRSEIAKALSDAGGAENFDTAVATLRDQIADHHDKKGLLSGVKEMFSRYYKKLKDPNVSQSEHKCPLCKRYFGEASEVDELTQMLDSQLQEVPQKMERLDRELKELLKKSEEFQRLKPQKERLLELESELPSLTERSDALTRKIAQLKAKQSELDNTICMRRDDVQSMDSMRSDAVIIDRVQTELKDLDKKLSAQQIKLRGAATNRSVPEVQKEYDETQHSMDELQQRITAHQEQLQRLRSRATELMSEKLRLQTGLQERLKLEETRQQLIADGDMLGKELQDIRQQAEPTKQLIASLEEELRALANEKNQALNRSGEMVQKLQNKYAEVAQLNKELLKYKNGGSAERLTGVQTQLSKLETQSSLLAAEREEILACLSKLADDLAAAQRRYSDLDTCQKLRSVEADLSKCQADIAGLRSKLGGIDTSESGERMLRKEQEDLLKQKHTVIERRSGLLNQKRELENQLQSAQYKTASKDYQEKLISLKTTEMAIGDMDKYYLALNRAIMTYHQTKMTELNRIIRELWRSTYRGSDIDAIEIHSENEGDSETGEVKSRRTFNYRVVMVKGDAVLDMRGRCSAGQKVLASLLIRLALAETFCISCGMLALDEPTTNLDRDNIESLAYALDTIIKKRSKQKNFQLVVITHDEAFVELIGRTVGVESYYRVSKSSDDGCSVIRKKSIEEFGTT